MPYKENTLKRERIDRFGITVDLPLFNQEKSVPVKYENLPDWVFSGSEFSQLAYNKFEKHFADQQIEYLNAILQLGGKATDNEVQLFFNDPIKWPSSKISARRNALIGLGIIYSTPVSQIKGPFGSPNSVWSVNYKKLYMLLLD
ncbi:MAG TPA: hypothetical protein PLT92_13510 [Ignavibacteriaceae bacterium]|nr:hypothetical protein [Ignavibacteriaceae bacterium]